ncbi:MAG: polysaccharide biosynthesis/export family protein [Terracidiphilus sp.]
MKSGNFLLAVFLASSLFCHAQAKAPAVSPAGQKAASPAARAAALADADTYVIGASDMLNVTIFKQPTLSGPVLVRPDGMISIPLLGDVRAAGKTPLQLGAEITEKLRKYIQDPDVTVVMTQINSKIVYLIGEVNKPGPIVLTPDMTLLQAIATAGGLTLYANSKKIYILRRNDGKQVKLPVRYKQALRGDASCNLTLNPDDTIVVP